MKKIIFFVTLSASACTFANTPSDIDKNETMDAALHACYGTQGAGVCLQSVLDKEKAKNSTAWTKLINSFDDAENKKDILYNLNAGKKSWEQGIKHDCEAAGLANTKDSPAYNNDLTACLASQYSFRTAFYNSLNTQGDDENEKKLLEDYLKNKKK